MNTLDRKKLNILIHLARIDGKFHKSEHELLNLFLKEKGLKKEPLDEKEKPIQLDELRSTDQRVELLYWAFKLVQADDLIHENEIAFCKNLAQEFSFKEELVDQYINKPMPDFKVFEKEITAFLLTS